MPLQKRAVRICVTLALAAFALHSGITAAAQSAPPRPAHQTLPACGAGPFDPAANDLPTLVNTLYASVSGPAHTPRDWRRMRALMAPGARITPTGSNAEGQRTAATLTVDEFIALNERLFEAVGFYEREAFHRIQRFGNVAHVWSAYETRSEPDGPVQARGMNTFQFLYDGQRWCLLSATWDKESPTQPILPEQW